MYFKIFPLLVALGLSPLVLIGGENPTQHKKANHTTMPAPNRNLALAPVELNTARAIRSIRLVETAGVIQLVSATLATTPDVPRNLTTISASRLQGAQAQVPAVLFSIGQLLPSPPAWDVRCIVADGSFQCALERAGGAINALVLSDQQGNRTPLSAANPLESFSAPRFIRRENVAQRASVSAIADNKLLVVFSGTLGGSKGGYIPIGECSDGLLVASANGFLSFAKRTTGGPARDGISPGTLECVRLDERFRPVGKPFQPLGPGVTIYEFDVDRLPGVPSVERFAVFATGPLETMLAYGSVTDDVFARVALSGGFQSLSMTRPAIAATDKGLVIACVERSLTPDARVWAGTLANQ